MFTGFIIHFYITFGTNLLTGGPTQNCCFQSFAEKEYQTESKRNETFGNVIFGTNMIQETWTLSPGSFQEATRVEGAPPTGRPPTGRAPLSRGTLVAPLTYLLHPYIPTWPKTSRTQHSSRVPPPEASVATKSQSGPCSGTLPEGGIPHRWPSSSSRLSP